MGENVETTGGDGSLGRGAEAYASLGQEALLADVNQNVKPGGTEGGGIWDKNVTITSGPDGRQSESVSYVMRDGSVREGTPRPEGPSLVTGEVQSQSAAEQIKPVIPVRVEKLSYIGNHSMPPGTGPGTPYAQEALYNATEVRSVLPASEIEKTPEQEQQTNDMIDAVKQFGLDLGVDLSNRMPTADQVHFFTPENYQKVRERYRLSPDNEAYRQPNGEIMVEAATDSPAENFGRAQHESMHLAGHNTLTTIGNAEDFRVIHERDGYTNNLDGTFSAFGEAIYEMTNLEIARTKWSKYESLKSIGEPEGGHFPSVVVVEALINKAAAALQKPFLDVLHHLQRGAFTGETDDAMVMLTQGLGEQAVNELALLRAKTQGADNGVWRRFAESVGLDEAISKFDRLKAGEDIRLLEDVR